MFDFSVKKSEFFYLRIFKTYTKNEFDFLDKNNVHSKFYLLFIFGRKMRLESFEINVQFFFLRFQCSICLRMRAVALFQPWLPCCDLIYPCISLTSAVIPTPSSREILVGVPESCFQFSCQNIVRYTIINFDRFGENEKKIVKFLQVAETFVQQNFWKKI